MSGKLTAALVLVVAATASAQVTAIPVGTMSDSLAGRRDSAVTPIADQSRGVDAEIRVALFELMAGRTVPALSRLQWLNASPVALTGVAATGALRGREDLMFLLAQSYYRLGVDSAFGMTAQNLIASGGGARYATILRAQLLLTQYRRGDYAGAIATAKSLGQSDVRGLAALVAGLAAYQTGSYGEARASFAAAQQSGAPYDAYARYMDALALLRGDTAQSGPAIQALTALAGNVSGDFGDQIRLTAAQVAYESRQYDQAATLAGAIAPTSGLGAQALLTRAWALYKANQIGPAGEAFADFARRFPQLPERDESRLMSAQALLQLGQTDQAATIFQSVVDSSAAEVSVLQAHGREATSAAARALVAGRAAGLLFITDPASGKTVALQDDAGADASLVIAAVSDTVPPAPHISAPSIVTLNDVVGRIDHIAALGGDYPRRILFAQTSATTNRTEYSRWSQALYSADAAVAIARYRLQEAIAAQQLRLAALRALSQAMGTENASFTAMATRLRATQDSLERVGVRLDAAATRIRQMFRAQIDATRLLANENVNMIDSLRNGLSAGLSQVDAQSLGVEGQTSATYARIAEQIDRGLNAGLSRHPAFALRDTVRLHGLRNRALLDSAQAALASAQQMLAEELARLEHETPANVMAMQASLAATDSRRVSAEAQVVTVVERELGARSNEMIAGLRRDTEAAEFGSASAAFFRALDASTTGPAATGTGAMSPTDSRTIGSAGATTAPRAATTPHQQ